MAFPRHNPLKKKKIVQELFYIHELKFKTCRENGGNASGETGGPDVTNGNLVQEKQVIASCF